MPCLKNCQKCLVDSADSKWRKQPPLSVSEPLGGGDVVTGTTGFRFTFVAGCQEVSGIFSKQSELFREGGMTVK